MTYDTVVFDNDGVLVGRTSFDVLREATVETFSKFGVSDPDPDDVDDMTVGATPARVEEVCNTYDLEPERFWKTLDRVSCEAQKHEARAGRKTPYGDVDTLAKLDTAVGVVSSNQQATVDFLVDHFDVLAPVETAYGREATVQSLDRRKPNSHYIDKALADLDADSALFVGDNESDVRAANNAGIDSAFIRRPHRRNWELNVWPTWEIEGLNDLHEICRK